MIKRVITFNQPVYLSTQDGQLIADLKNESTALSIPIEDIGLLLLEHYQITLTHGLINALMENNTCIISCDKTYHPNGLMLPIEGHHLHSARFKAQLDATVPFFKQLWQFTIKQKILNQAAVLKSNGQPIQNMKQWARKVRSGDPTNYEARAAAFYWKKVFPSLPGFLRNPDEAPPNHLLNYGYSILRAAMARAIVSAGLHPSLGIHHRNQYNAFCLADDLMEPYRPFVDHIVRDMVESGTDYNELTKEIKKKLLHVLTADILINEERSPLWIGIQMTATSLAQCFTDERTKILFPTME